MQNPTNLYKDRVPKPYDHQAISGLVILAQKGNESAFNDLINQFYPIVHRRVWHLIPEIDVEDVTQEVFLAAIKSLKNFRGDAKFSTWLHTITSRQVANYYRTQGKRPKQVDQDIDEYAEILPAAKNGPWKNPIDDLVTVQRGLANLSPEHQEIILMRLVERIKFQEIADILEISLDAAKSRFRRAMKTMQREIGYTNG